MAENQNGTLAKRQLGAEIILAFETGVGGGSISLWTQGREIDFWIGSGDVSKSEDVLDETNKILERSRVNIGNIERVVFSSGPGSYTGLKIGASIAKGLSKSLGCRLSAHALLEAMTFGAGEHTVAAVPFGSRQICWQFFDGASGTVEAVPHQKGAFVSETRLFAEHLKHSAFKSIFKKLILHKYIYEEFAKTGISEFFTEAGNNIPVLDAGGNLARFIAEKACRDGQTDDITETRLIYPTAFKI